MKNPLWKHAITLFLYPAALMIGGYYLASWWVGPDFHIHSWISGMWVGIVGMMLKSVVWEIIGWKE